MLDALQLVGTALFWWLVGSDDGQVLLVAFAVALLYAIDI